MNPILNVNALQKQIGDLLEIAVDGTHPEADMAARVLVVAMQTMERERENAIGDQIDEVFDA